MLDHELVVSVVSTAMPEAFESIQRDLEEMLRERVGMGAQDGPAPGEG